MYRLSWDAANWMCGIIYSLSLCTCIGSFFLQLSKNKAWRVCCVTSCHNTPLQLLQYYHVYHARELNNESKVLTRQWAGFKKICLCERSSAVMQAERIRHIYIGTGFIFLYILHTLCILFMLLFPIFSCHVSNFRSFISFYVSFPCLPLIKLYMISAPIGDLFWGQFN